MIDAIAGALTPQFGAGFLIGGVLVSLIYQIKMKRALNETLCEAMILVSHVNAYSELLDEEGVSQERVDAKLEKQLNNDTILEAYRRTGRL